MLLHLIKPLNLKFTRTQVIKGAIPKLLPTEFIIIMIKYDEQIGFISDYLNKITIENILNNDILNQEDISLIVKIKEIKETKTYKPNNLTEMEQKEIVVSDTNSQHTISLFLYNEQIFFTKLLKKV